MKTTSKVEVSCGTEIKCNNAEGCSGCKHDGEQEIGDISVNLKPGSLKWRNAMFKRVARLIAKKEELTKADIAFLEEEAEKDAMRCERKANS